MDVFVHIAEIYFSILHKYFPFCFSIHTVDLPPSVIHFFHCHALFFCYIFRFPSCIFSHSATLSTWHSDGSRLASDSLFPGFSCIIKLIRTEVIAMSHPTIEQLMIQNLQNQNAALQKRYQTLEELLDTKEALILNQNKLILNLQTLCDKQQTLLDELSNPQ